MESILIIGLGVFALYYLCLKQDQAADKLLGEEFDRYERIYNGVAYSCQHATVVKKRINKDIVLPLVPSPSYSAKVLCQTENKDWFWFDANIKYMKLATSSITPIIKEEAFQALKDDPESLQRYFPDYDQHPTV